MVSVTPSGGWIPAVIAGSTGIGMRGSSLVMSCMAMRTTREDLCLFPLENPQQTPAYCYHEHYSPKSPKFSRAMGLILGHYVTTWVSGTASIVGHASFHTAGCSGPSIRERSYRPGTAAASGTAPCSAR